MSMWNAFWIPQFRTYIKNQHIFWIELCLCRIIMCLNFSTPYSRWSIHRLKNKWREWMPFSFFGREKMMNQIFVMLNWNFVFLFSLLKYTCWKIINHRKQRTILRKLDMKWYLNSKDGESNEIIKIRTEINQIRLRG